MHNKILLLLILLLSSCATFAQSTRIKLTQLEQAPVVTGSRQGQIGMSDVAGNQRYTPYVIIADTCTNVPPAPSGNTNISQFVYNCAGDSIWYIDWRGDAILIGGGGSAGCDEDWLDISSNLCPDDITDSIYTYLYASVGARYAWPLAEFLVNDSTAAAISVIQGSRNARLGFHDSQNDTWSAIDQGGTTTTWYLERDAELIITAADGSISIPTIPFTNHFGVRTGDSTLVFYRYPSSRVDTNTVNNILHTDASGVLKSANLNNTINNIGFGNVMYHDDTYTGLAREGSWVNRFNGSFVNTLDSLLTYGYNNTEGARIEISPGGTDMISYPFNRPKNGKHINIIGGPGSNLDLTATFQYNSPDTVISGGLLLYADTIRLTTIANANLTRVMPTNHAIDIRCNTIRNGSAAVSKSAFFNLNVGHWSSNSGIYLVNPVFTQPRLGDTVTNVQASISIDRITLTGTGTSPRALSYLNSQFDSCSLEYRIGSIKKAGSIAAGTGRGFGIHVYSFGSTDTTTVKNSKINTYVGSVSLEGVGASDQPLIVLRPGTPGGGTDYPIYIQNSEINYDLGAVGISEKLIEFSNRTEISNSTIKVTVGNSRVTNDNMIYFQRVKLDSTTIIFEGDYTSTSSGNPLIYLDSVTFTNGSKIIFRGKYEHQRDGTPVVRILNMSSIPIGSIVFDDATLIAYDTATIIGTAAVSARSAKFSTKPTNTINLSGNYQITNTSVIENLLPFFLLADSTNIRFQEKGGLNYTEIAAGQQASNIYYQLPVVNGQDGEVLTWRPGGLLEWDSIAGGGGGGGGIYADTGTVAPIDDFLVRLREDTTFSIAYTNNNGFEDHINSGGYFEGFYHALDFWGGYGLYSGDTDNGIETEIGINGTTQAYIYANRNNYSSAFYMGGYEGTRFEYGTPSELLGTMLIDSFFTTNILHLSGFNYFSAGLPADINANIADSAGVGATVSMVSAQSSDVAGRFSVTSGTGASPGLWVTLNFSLPYKTPPTVQFDCENAECAGLRWYSNTSTTNVELFISSGESDNTSYSFNYHIIQAE